MGQPVVAPAPQLSFSELLIFVATKFAFLFYPYGYRIVGSQVTESFGGDCLVRLESKSVRIEITRDRGQMLLEFQPMKGKRGDSFSLGMLRGLLTGDPGGSEVLNDDWVAFLAKNIAELEARFSDPVARKETVAGLKKQERLRAKEMFG